MRRIVLAEEQACARCGSEATPTVDHKRPLSQGGTHARENLQRLCQPCNQSKAGGEGGTAPRNGAGA